MLLSLTIHLTVILLFLIIPMFPNVLIIGLLLIFFP